MAGGNNSGDPRWSGRARDDWRRRKPGGLTGDDDAPLIVGAVDVAIRAPRLPRSWPCLPMRIRSSAHRLRAVLADVRQLEAITARAVRSSHGAPSVVRSLGTVRRFYTS